jgi:hypothetical protein
VRKPAGDVERIAGLHGYFAVKAQLIAMLLARKRLGFDRELHDRFVNAPRFLAFDLDDRRIVRIVVNAEALRRRGRQIDVRLYVPPGLGLERIAELLHACAKERGILDDEGPALPEKLGNLAGVDRGDGCLLGVVCANRRPQRRVVLERKLRRTGFYDCKVGRLPRTDRKRLLDVVHAVDAGEARGIVSANVQCRARVVVAGKRRFVDR